MAQAGPSWLLVPTASTTKPSKSLGIKFIDGVQFPGPDLSLQSSESSQTSPTCTLATKEEPSLSTPKVISGLDTNDSCLEIMSSQACPTPASSVPFPAAAAASDTLAGKFLTVPDFDIATQAAEALHFTKNEILFGWTIVETMYHSGKEDNLPVSAVPAKISSQDPNVQGCKDCFLEAKVVHPSEVQSLKDPEPPQWNSYILVLQ